MENLLTSLAFLDAFHDFGSLANTYKNVIRESLPGQIFNIPDEDTAIDITSTYAEHVSNIGHEPNEIFTNLGGSATTPIAILCDASFCSGIISQLEKNTIGKVYFIRNREVIMDPGPNLTVTDSNNLFVATDIDNNKISYSKYIRPENNYTHIFKELHSTLDLTIEKRNDGYVLSTFNNNSLIETVDKCFINNNVPNITRAINYATNNDTIKSCFLRKRSGDWLQVLSCLDKSRK